MPSQEKLIEAINNWANLYMSRSLSEFFSFLNAARIPMQQAYVLTYIYHNGSSKISKICEHMLVSPAAASQMIDRLEKQKLVQRVPDQRDGRVRNVILTEQGEILVKESIAARQNWINDIPAKLNHVEMEQITRALQQLSAAYRK
ncbi:MAG: MarR family winged helix-turn-helix transcriptional regulator [Anaerolineales bacterium]